MRVVETNITDVFIVEPKVIEDSRGYFSETYSKNTYADAGIDVDFVQDNESLSHSAGTIRGLHFQISPAAQVKLVRAVSGAIFDVAVDLRVGSPTFGQHVGAVLSAEKHNQLLIPAGFAHGFCTLARATVTAYKISRHYSAELERGIRWDDPDLAIEWPVDREQVTISEKDRGQPRWRDIPE